MEQRSLTAKKLFANQDLFKLFLPVKIRKNKKTLDFELTPSGRV